MYKATLIVFLLAPLFQSCNSKEDRTITSNFFDGIENLKKVETFYASGKKELIFYLDEEGKFHKELIRWYESGNMSAKWQYHHGVKNGIQLKWWENGVPSGKQVYYLGKLNGAYIIWDNKGKRMENSIYKMDSLVYSEKFIDSILLKWTFEDLIKHGVDSDEANNQINALYK